jgi:polar amino acid transport system substrate-binding protein
MPAGVLQQIQRRGYLVAGVDLNTLLLSYEDPRSGAQLQGFEIDLVDRIARAIFGDDDQRVRYVALTTDQRVTAVEHGTVDLAADAITVNCARMQQAAFSAQYLLAAQRVLVPTSSTAQGISDLKGRRICATAGSTSIGIINDYGAIPYPVATRIDCLVALQRRRVAAITSDDTILAGFQAQDPFTKVVGADLAPEPYAVAVSLAPDREPLVRLVNGVLEQMRVTGDWQTLYNRWLEPHLGVAGVQPVPAYEG